jgi:hypothetical protein
MFSSVPWYSTCNKSLLTYCCDMQRCVVFISSASLNSQPATSILSFYVIGNLFSFESLLFSRAEEFNGILLGWGSSRVT